MSRRAKVNAKQSGKVPFRQERHGQMFQARAFATDAKPGNGSPISRTPRASRANQTGIPDRLKAGLEGLSGVDLSGVRVHYNSPKPAQIQALAYAQGREIHLAPGQEQHLAHEGWHAVQQMQGRVQTTKQVRGVSINDDASLEHEADVMGMRALRMGQGSRLPTGQVDELRPLAPARSGSAPTRGVAEHDSGCGCAGCLRVPGSRAAGGGWGALTTARPTRVIQGNWKCTDCGETGKGKPKKICPNCGVKGSLVENAGELSFGDWWDSIGDARRQKLLRKHGSHEAHGGQQQKFKGGGKKGGQHDVGVAKAKSEIKEKYEKNEYQ